MPTPSEPMFIACAIERVRVKAQALGLDPDEVVREAADKARTSATHTLVTAADEIIARALRAGRMLYWIDEHDNVHEWGREP